MILLPYTMAGPSLSPASGEVPAAPMNYTDVPVAPARRGFLCFWPAADSLAFEAEGLHTIAVPQSCGVRGCTVLSWDSQPPASLVHHC